MRRCRISHVAVADVCARKPVRVCARPNDAGERMTALGHFTRSGPADGASGPQKNNASAHVHPIPLRASHAFDDAEVAVAGVGAQRLCSLVFR